MKTISYALTCNKEERIILRWRIDSVRAVWKIVFIILRQRSDKIQLIVEWENSNLPWKESIIEIEGKLVQNKSVKLWWVEVVVDATDIKVISEPIEEIPIDRSNPETYPGLELRLNERHISLREPKISLAFEVQSYADYKLREFGFENWFIEIHSPKLLGTPSESWAELFSLEYFGKEAYLAQSPQFYKQMALAAWFEKVLEVWPVFRAEPSQTSRHNTEFISTDFEIAHIESHHDVMDFEESMIVYLMTGIKEKFGERIKSLYDIEIEIPTSFPRIEFGRAVEILEQEYWLKTEKGADISSEWEKLIAEYVKKKWNSDFVFLIDYPIEVRPFYHMRDSETNITKSFDLLYKWLEITTWAQREHRYDVLKEQAIQKMWSIESIDFYLNFFKHWMPAHWWLWFGRVRFFTKMFGFDNIREMTFLPRDPKRITP